MSATTPNPSHCDAILAWLKAGHKLTALECLERFGCMNLKGRIHDLKVRKAAIVKDMIKLPNGKRVAEYYLRQPAGIAPDGTIQTAEEIIP